MTTVLERLAELRETPTTHALSEARTIADEASARIERLAGGDRGAPRGYRLNPLR